MDHERLSQLPQVVLADTRMKRALRVLSAVSSGDFAAFFRELLRYGGPLSALSFAPPFPIQF